MKILILSDSDSPHTLKWIRSLVEHNLEIGLFSIHTSNLHLYSDLKNITIYDADISRKYQERSESNLSKLIYLRSFLKLKKVIKKFKPDIVHSHYASSYGLLGSLTNFHPYIISAWGSDVFKFPNYSVIHKNILKFNLYRADEILSTSYALRKETNKYTKKNILITSFGVDTEKFKPLNKEVFTDKNEIVIGTIKTLEENYGIEYLIRGFKILEDEIPNQQLKLLLVGKGTQENYLKSLVSKLNIKSKIEFAGYINPDLVPQYHNMIDISVFPSIEESFGVAVLEASACCKPVIVSRVGGMPEVVDENETGFIVEKQNPEAIAKALKKLVDNSVLRSEMGKKGRNKVINEFNWNDSVKKMLSIYNELLSNSEKIS
ncbi:MAG: glycosyltransferase [Ignavibacteriaceae bacterium]